MQEIDAERRLKILRGEPVDPVEDTRIEPTDHARSERELPYGRERKRRRVAGEDDTDRDIRHFKEDQLRTSEIQERQESRKSTSSAPITDRYGYINLFPAQDVKPGKPKNPEVEAEANKKKKELEDQYTMRFSNAAGFKQDIGQKPWYSSTSKPKQDDNDKASKNVWGNEDPRRKERDKLRMAADDPLAAITKGVHGVRKAERDRKKWREEQSREIDDLIKDERKEAKRRRRRESSLEGFGLDRPEKDQPEKDSQDRHHRRHRHHKERESHHRRRHRSRSPDRQRHPHSSSTKVEKVDV